MSKIVDHISYLADKIGPRGSTSKEEKKAAEYVNGYLKSLGEDVEVFTQYFRSPKTWSWTNIFILLLVLLAVPVYLFSPLLAAIMTGLAIIFFITENDNKPILSRLMLKYNSQNVIGRIKARQTSRNKVVLVAHIDSSRADFAHHPRRVAGFRKTVLLNLFLFSIIFLIYSTGVFFDLINEELLPNRFEWIITILLTIPIIYILILIILREWRYDLVPGANDNASGVGIVLELMNSFSSDPLQNTEVSAVLTGCEEVGCNGMIEYLKFYGEEHKNTYFINLDNCGQGNPVFSPVEGIFFPHKADPDLLRLARKVQNEYPELEVEERQFRAGYTDGTAAMVRGFKAISFLAINEQGVPINWHWYSDVTKNIEENTVENVKDFVQKLVTAIDQDV